MIYEGVVIDLLNFQLTMLGSGTFSNTNSILLSVSDSLLIIAGDVTIAKIKVAANSGEGKGLLVRSTDANVTNLNLLADMRLSYSDDSHELNVENLNVDSTSKIIGDDSEGWLLVTEVIQQADVILTLQDVNVRVKKELKIDYKDQVVMTGSTVFEIGGGLTFNVSGTMNFNRGPVRAHRGPGPSTFLMFT